MAIKSEEFFHDKWLGMVQTDSDGLVVAKPVLLEAQCMNHQPPETQERLRELCPPGPEESPRHIVDLLPFFKELLDLDADLFDAEAKIPEEVSLYAPEGPQSIRPSFGLLRQDEPEPREGAGSPASNAAEKYVALVWDVTSTEGETNEDAIGLPLDKPETTTGGWSYPAAAKFDRLLRHCRVPVGILTNREVIRLVYAPHGESSGHITFRIDDMATVGGRPILDAMIMLLCANQWFGVSDENALSSLLRRSREYQGTVTEDLAEQVFSGLQTLLKGFQTAAERDKSGLLREALERDEDHLYRGLLTVMLRLVFILYAEDRGLLPVDHPLYAQRMSLLGLFERLQRDHGNFPDSMNNRFGAWGHLISLFRAIFLGVEHGDFHIPPRQGDLFDPHRYPFLEGWYGPSAPIVLHEARAEVKVPTVDDGTVFALLRSLLIFQGQRLSYRTLDVEQIGSVYEALMGYHVSVCESPAVAIKVKDKKGAAQYWLEPAAVMARPAGQRVKWLKDDCGFDKPVAARIKKALDGVGKENARDENAAIEALLPLAAGRRGLSPGQQAGAGQYVLQPGSERRRSGTQYTPRSLTEPIVRKTLEPLIRCLGEEPTADQLLELKICDPAMGSGAFLVECCRQLAEEVEAAWAREHKTGEIAATCPGGNVIAHARRLVAQRCLYGVDKNAMAVQLAKLSLWLFTLARDLPFTFLDHCFRHGDSLVGLDLEQLKAFHWKPTKQLSLFQAEVKRALDEVVAIRQEIHQLAGDTSPEGQKLKAQMLFDANDATEKVRSLADVCVGAFFAGTTNKDRSVERQLREERVHAWLQGSSESRTSVEDWVDDARKQQAPFHWWLEFPEVFYEERPDPLRGLASDGAAYFDGVVGNPPFLSGLKISGVLGNSYLAWQKEQFGLRNAKIDLSALFVRRASELLGGHGIWGLITTNSISEGATREAALMVLSGSGWTIFSAIPSMEWPGGNVGVTVAIIHAAIGACVSTIPAPSLNGRTVSAIDSNLESRVERQEPFKLLAAKKVASQGVIAQGEGFFLTFEEADRLVSQDERNRAIIVPYIGGDEVNNRPMQDPVRSIINFGSRSLDEAEEYPALLDIVRERVKPERDALRDDQASARAAKAKWWRFWAPREDLYSRLRELPRCLVTACGASTHMCFSFQPTTNVFANTLHVFALSDSASFALLQSRLHEAWAYHRSSSFRGALRYSLTKAFSTFPFPRAEDAATLSSLETAGEAAATARAALMAETNRGLTAIYNALKDTEVDDREISNLRVMHEGMDRAVLEAYGWSDIEVPPYCPMNEAEEADLETFTEEVIDRLYVLNAERAAEEKRQGLSGKPAAKKSKKQGDTTMSLPGMGNAKA